ncbi:MAG: ATP-binding protein [Candidatus Thorarchaeota archaeon]
MLTDLMEHISSTADVTIPSDPFERIVGQNHAVTLVKSAVVQRRHVLLCGPPGVGKSLLAKAAATLLPPPTEEIRVHHNPLQPDRPRVSIVKRRNAPASAQNKTTRSSDVYYVRPEELPIEVAVKMGYRCPSCGSLSTPDQGMCLECGAAKRCDWVGENSYHGLFRVLHVIHERAMPRVQCREERNGVTWTVSYERDAFDTIRVTAIAAATDDDTNNNTESHVIVGIDTPRFVRITGGTAVELLGDVKHDPYGSAEGLGVPAFRRVIPGAIHEAHEGILYVDEVATLGPLQKHLLTAMQEKRYPIVGHNPHSSGAAVRVDGVPCDFVLFASANPEDLSAILPPLRSRIRGYGYEIMLSSWMKKTPEAIDQIVRFVAQTVVEDGKIPHFAREAVEEVLSVAEEMARTIDRQRDALTLRLRELGGVVRSAGDLAVHDDAGLVERDHVRRAKKLARELRVPDHSFASKGSHAIDMDDYGSYFF